MKRILTLTITAVLILLMVKPAFADSFSHFDDDQKSDGSDIQADGPLEVMDISALESLTVCIDPGHGGSEPGSTLYNGGYEKNNNLKIALFLRDALEEYSNVSVIMTRTEDVQVSLGERAQIAAAGGADLLISIHTDAGESDAWRGLSIFYPNEHYSKSISDAGYAVAVNVRNELKALGLSEFQGITTRDIEADDPDLEYESGQRSFTYPATDADRANGITIYESSIIPGYRYTLGDYYGVIRNSKRLGVPAIIVEHGFGSNADDYAQFMSTDKKLQALAEADARAIAATYGLHKSEFRQLDDGNWYYYENGVIREETFLAQGTVDGVFGIWYVNNGCVDFSVNGLAEIEGEEYYFENGVLQTGFTGMAEDDSGFWYVKDGVVDTGYNGFIEDGGEIWYIVNGKADTDVTADLVEGWNSINGAWCYMTSSGTMAKGWNLINEKWYYFDPSCIMATGWRKVKGTWYYLRESGAMATGWLSVNGKWYYLSASGAMRTGWQFVNNKWYFLHDSGAMATGWIYDRGRWYYLSGSGAMQTGWQKINGKWYYLSSSGAMVTGWQEINGKWYYFNSSGAWE